jgi:hypothetical protein
LSAGRKRVPAEITLSTDVPAEIGKFGREEQGRVHASRISADPPAVFRHGDAGAGPVHGVDDEGRSAFGGVVELVLLEFIAERGEVELEHFGGLASVAAGLLHGLAEEIRLEAGHDLLEGHVVVNEAAAARFDQKFNRVLFTDLGGEVGDREFVVDEEREPLDNIPQFADISRPGILAQRA